MGKAGTRDGDAPHRTARLPVGDTKVVHGGWDAMVRPTVGAPMGADRLVPRRPIPVQAQVQPPASPYVAFQRLVEKLDAAVDEGTLTKADKASVLKAYDAEVIGGGPDGGFGGGFGGPHGLGL